MTATSEQSLPVSGAAGASDGAQRRAAWGIELGTLLTALLGLHSAWLTEVHAHREAMRHADAAGVQGSVRRQAELLQQIADLEELRAGLVNRVGASPDFQQAGSAASGRGNGPLTLSQIAALLDEPHRSRLTGSAGELRGLIEQVQKENRTLRAAAGSLMAHMEGLRQVARRLSHAGTYGRRGFVEPCPGIATAVDLTR